MHLTNYAINKRSKDFVFNNDTNKDDIGHKRSFSSVLKVYHFYYISIYKIKDMMLNNLYNKLNKS